MARFVDEMTRRHLVQALLLVLQEYSTCSIASQVCVKIMVQISGQYDVIDVAQLQKFVIDEFKNRH